MQTSMTYSAPAAAPPAPTAGCPPHAWITVGTLTSCSRCGTVRWGAAPNLMALALVSARALPDLWVPAPGETPTETAARWDAARHILDDLLDEIAADLAEWERGAAA